MAWLLYFWLVVISTYTTFGLAAVWAGRGKGNWFPRSVALLLLSGAWLLVPAYELWLVFLTQILAAMLVLRLARRRNDDPRKQEMPADWPRAISGRASFSLTDMCLAVLIVAIIFAVLSRTPADIRTEWYGLVLSGAVLAFMTLVAVWAVTGTTRLWIRLLAIFVVFPAWVIAAWLWLGEKEKAWRFRGAAGLGLALVALPTAVFYGWLIWPRFWSPPGARADNGYTDLVAAAEILHDHPVNLATLSGEQLHEYLTRNNAAIELARAGLRRECSCPWPDKDKLIDEATRMRELARIFAAEGRWHASASRYRQAVDSDLNAVRLGQAVAVDGFCLDHSVGYACEGTGLEALRKLVGRLNEDDCQRLAARLTVLCSTTREPFESIAARERRFTDMMRPWNERFVLLQLAPTWDAERHALAKQLSCINASTRLLQTHVALRRYHLATRRYPSTLHELVPQYLDVLPIDPFSGKILIYRLRESAYLLYSVGPDGKDDGGVPITGAAPNAPDDFSFDVESEPTD